MDRAAATIPHLFYDLLARVIPGCYFILIIERLSVGRHIWLDSEPENLIESLMDGVAFVILGYVMGWVLSILSMSRLRWRLRKLLAFFGLQDECERGQRRRAEYYEIRQFDRETGFRILKLRAEARMLESLFTGTVLLCIILITLPTADFRGRVLTVGALSVAGLSFLLAIFSAWRTYDRSIEKHYQLCVRTPRGESARDLPGPQLDDSASSDQALQDYSGYGVSPKQETST